MSQACHPSIDTKQIFWYFLDEITSLLEKIPDQQKDLIPKKTFIASIDRFKTMPLLTDQKHRLLTLVEQVVSVTYKNLKVQNQSEFCKKIGNQLNQLWNQAYFRAQDNHLKQTQLNTLNDSILLTLRNQFQAKQTQRKRKSEQNYNQINFFYGAKKLAQAIQNFKPEEQNLNYLMLKGDIYLENRNLSQALEEFLRSQKKISELQQKNGKSNDLLLNSAQCSKKIARILYKQLKFQEAIKQGQNSLLILQKIPGQQSSVAQLLNWIGRGYYRLEGQQNFKKALSTYQKGLQISEKIGGKQSLGCAESYHNLGSLYNNAGNFQKAYQFYGKSLQIRQNQAGKNSFLSAQVLTSLGGLHRQSAQKATSEEDKKNHYKKAEQILIRCFEIFKNERGADNTNCAKAAYKLALLYKQLDRKEDALKYAHYAYDVRKQAQHYGQDHQRAAKVKKLIAKLQQKTD